MTVYLPAADFYTNQEHFENIVGAYTQLIVAGLAGFIVGQTLNAWVVVLIKERTKEKYLWARLVGSTFVGQFGDTMVFCTIAAGAIGITSFGDFATYTAQGWLYKTAVEVVTAADHLPGDRVHQAPGTDVSAGTVNRCRRGAFGAPVAPRDTVPTLSKPFKARASGKAHRGRAFEATCR